MRLLMGSILLRTHCMGATILTPEQTPRTIIIEYHDHTWRLPGPILRTPDEKLFLLNTHNSFTPLYCDHEALSLLSIPDAATSSHSEIDQRKFELMCTISHTRQKQSQILHESDGHRNARDTFRDLEATGVPVHHLKRYILAHKYKWCESNLGRKSYYCQKARQPGGDLEMLTIIDPLNPKIKLTETLANIHQVTSAPDHPAWKLTMAIEGDSFGALAIDTATWPNFKLFTNPPSRDSCRGRAVDLLTCRDGSEN
jgi:hypothetical protein